MPTPLCHAPFTSLHLDPSGHVRVCELNSLAMLGKIPQSRLLDLWTGRTIRSIRSALTDGDTSRGCEDCASPLAAGDRHLAHASYYDGFAEWSESEPSWPSQLELSLSNVCNLQCTMCNGDLSSAIRSRREGLPPLPRVYDDQFFEDLTVFLPHLRRVTFIGGEPFLGPESLRVFDLLTELDEPTPCWVTTNGTVFNTRVERVLDSVPTDVSISMDGATPGTYESIRVGSSFRRVLENLERFRRSARRVSLNFCLMTVNWHEFRPFLAMADDLDLDVHVNVVTSPPQMSLYHLAANDLREILSTLATSEQTTPSLTRSMATWNQQIERLDRHLTNITADVAVDPPHRRSSPPATPAAPWDIVAWADSRGVHELCIGASDVLISVDPKSTDVLGMDLQGLIGGHLTSLVAFLNEQFGDLITSERIHWSDGTEGRRMVFASGDSHTELRAVLRLADPEVAGSVWSTWTLAARSSSMMAST